MEKVRRSCGYQSGIERGDASIVLQSFSHGHIDAIVEETEGKKWRLTGFYRSPYMNEREEAWNLLRRLSNQGEYPWLDCQLADLGYSGNWFTWERGNLPETNIQEKLDRGVGTEQWRTLFPDFIIQHLPHFFSDHCPILINIENNVRRNQGESFRFEAWWILEDTFLEEVKMSWGASSGDLLNKLLATLLEADRDDENMAEIIDTKIHLNMEIDKDESYWKQRARINWLKLGDRNTSFFHKQTSLRKKRNLIQNMHLRRRQR
ncbi:reverse transcriptase [Gossypium australe]|uniref:Reverse transcriptase n=1 Tax=Gossypium australe TaxID=47621 RepID=A0A5B6VGU1_9ROSI|nr:reverse transcriptase [Gossypium australe]